MNIFNGVILLVGLFSSFACAEGSSNKLSVNDDSQMTYVLNLEKGDLAIEGYDAVAYFSLSKSSKAIKGKEEFSDNWGGATWYFSSNENLNTFKTNPEKYIPQYGGYCAYAAARNYLYSVDPNAWTVKNSKLYLNASTGLRRSWLKNADSEISKADRNWPNLRSR